MASGPWVKGSWSRPFAIVRRSGRSRRQCFGIVELLNFESTGINEMARDYLETGDDPETQASIQELLDLMTFTNEDLEGMAGLGPTTLGLLSTDSLTWLQEAETDCTRMYGEELGVSKCLEFEAFEVNGKQYRVFRPSPDVPQGGWTEARFKLAVTAVKESVPKLDMHGITPPANIVFTVSGHKYAEADDNIPCGVFLHTKLQPFSNGDFKQVVAHELGHCFNGATFPDQAVVDYGVRKWWEEGLADYWSNVVYPSNKLEWRTLEKLAQSEQATTLFDRTYANAIFFQHLESPIGIPGIKSVISNLPGATGATSMRQAMASYSGMDTLYHDFVRAMADSEVIDTSGVLVPYQPVGWELPIAGPTEVPLSIPPFGVRRLHITVPDGMYGCYETFQQGDMRVSWREGDLGDSGDWDETGPTELEGETVLVVTTLEEGATFTLDVRDVDDDPDCSDEEETRPPDTCELNVVCDPSGYYFFSID